MIQGKPLCVNKDLSVFTSSNNRLIDQSLDDVGDTDD